MSEKQVRRGSSLLPEAGGAWAVFFMAAACKSQFMSGYRSTDFEVHRNWLAVTNLPFNQWYTESTSEWTLDYPPFFAVFQYVLGFFAKLVDPGMLNIQEEPYESYKTIYFMRLSVIVTDVFLLLGLCCLLKSLRYAMCPHDYSPIPSAVYALVVGSPGLFLLDHMHFQYNGWLTGLLLASLGYITRGVSTLQRLSVSKDADAASDESQAHRDVLCGAAAYAFLLCCKHIYLYIAPVFFIFLLRAYCFKQTDSGSLSFAPTRFISLGFTIVTIMALAFGPIMLSNRFFEMVTRLFPFGRGLTHAYWAPNVWALYSFADIVLAKILRKKVGTGAVGGLAQVVEMAALPNIKPKVTFALTLLVYLPLLAFVWKKPVAPLFAAYCALGNAIAFTFGWHVHEKAILGVTLPLAAVAASIRDRRLLANWRWLSAVANFSILPLLPRPQDQFIAVFFGMAALLYEGALARTICRSWGENYKRTADSLPLPLKILCMCTWTIFFICALGWYALPMVLPRLEFLPLMITSVACACLVLPNFFMLFINISRIASELTTHKVWTKSKDE